MSVSRLSFAELVMLAERTGVKNWRDPKTGRAGAVISAPSSWRGQRGSMGTVVGCTRHHTGTAESFRATEDYPTYQVVKEGRSGLDNSLSAYGLGRFYGIYVFSEFLSWHAGAWSYAGITDGNGHFLGIEAEGTGAIWTPFQREFYPRLCGSILSYIGEGVSMMPRHMDGAMPRGRKSDAANLWTSFTGQVQSYIDNPRTLTYGGTTTVPSPPEQEEIEMLIVNVNPREGVWVPHLITGDRYFALESDDTRKKLVAAGIKSITVGQAAHERFRANLSSEKADPVAAATTG